MLPVEILYEIFQFCSVVDYFAIRRTCNHFYEIIQHLVISSIKEKFDIQLHFKSQFHNKEPSYRNVVSCLSHINIVSSEKNLSFTIDKTFLLKLDNWATLNSLIRMKLMLLWFIEMINFISYRIAARNHNKINRYP
jgi:hypothetical protein